MNLIKNSLFAFIFLASFVVSIAPEDRSVLLTDSAGWEINTGESGKFFAQDIVPPYRYSRSSQNSSKGSFLFRTWTHEGNILLDIRSEPFTPPKYGSILLTGGHLSLDKKVESYIECIASENRLQFFRGTVNTNLIQSVFSIPDGWCDDKVRLVIKTLDANETIGIGGIFEISKLSYLKSRFMGLIAYYFIFISALTIIFLVPGLFAKHFSLNRNLLFPAVFLLFGALSLAFFYLSYFLSTIGVGIYFPYSVVSLALIFIAFRNFDNLKELAKELLPYWKVWILCSLFFTAVLLSASNGVAHWEPNIRFWPAFWSSDNELPWMFAEAVMNRWPLDGLFGGWQPTDRPPLMTASYLLVAPILHLMQSNNDGYYLTGVIYNVQAIILSSLLAPVLLYVIRAAKGFQPTFKISREETILLIFCFATPFIFFNVVYGWPKIFGAAFGILALATLLKSSNGESENQSIAISLGLLAFSFLAHGSTIFFIIPIVFITIFRVKNFSNFIYIAKCCLFACLVYLSWSIFKYLVLPSKDPVTKYALTGDFHFGDPDTSLIRLILERYGSLGIAEWLKIKWLMVCQQFTPIKYQLIEFGLNYEPSMNAFENIRARDFLFLSSGNIVLPLLLLTTLIIFLRRRAIKLIAHVNHQSIIYSTFIKVGFVAWLLMIILFLTPAVLHHWPYAAFVAMLIGSAAIVYESYRKFFIFIFALLATYTSLNWVLFPILNALSADYLACFTLGLFYVAFIFYMTSKWSKRTLTRVIN